MAESGVFTLAQLRTLSQQRSNLENSLFVTDAEWNQYINDSIKELYDLLVTLYGNDYYATSVTFSTDGSTYLYELPNGTNYSAADPFYKILGLDLALVPTQTDSFVTIRTFSFADRNRFAVPNFQSFYGVTNLRYRLLGTKLWLTPIPASGQTLKLWYVPRCADLTDDDDTFDGFSGWTEYVVIDAAVKAMIKQELDISMLELQKQQMIKRINDSAQNRDAANPSCVTDTQGQDSMFPSGNGSNSGSWGAF